MTTMKWKSKQRQQNNPSPESNANLTGERYDQKFLKKQLKTLLKSISLDDLELIARLDSQDYSYIDEVIYNLPEMIKLVKERDKLLKTTKELALTNYAREPYFVKYRIDLAHSLEQLQEDVRRIKSKATTCRKPLEETHRKIIEASNEIEEKSENLAKNFMEKRLDYDEFIPQYIEDRKLAHVRRVKADRILRDINKLNQYLN